IRAGVRYRFWPHRPCPWLARIATEARLRPPLDSDTAPRNCPCREIIPARRARGRRRAPHEAGLRRLVADRRAVTVRGRRRLASRGLSVFGCCPLWSGSLMWEPANALALAEAVDG